MSTSTGERETAGSPSAAASSEVVSRRNAVLRPGSGPTPGGGPRSEAAPSPEATPSPKAVPSPETVSRRTALKVIASAAALGAAPSCAPDGSTRSAHETLSGFDPLPPSNPLAAGTLTDPDLLAPVVPWEMVLTDEEMRLVAVLADMIIPADERSPSAADLGVPAYVNEFVSAPGHEEHLLLVRAGLAWLNRAARERFEAVGFPELDDAQRREICDEIAYEPAAPDDLKVQARFFDLFRDMTATGFWTTEEGMADLGYVGNVPLPSFDGPPPEVLERLGLSGDDLA